MMFGKIDYRAERNKRLRADRKREAKRKGTYTKEQWAALKSEFDSRCVQCGFYCPHPTKDHIVPLYQGGSDGIDNIQPLCRSCNSAKGSERTNWAEYRRTHGWDI
jgi:5-methylcytosine-specific restriction endonuclease McrA